MITDHSRGRDADASQLAGLLRQKVFDEARDLDAIVTADPDHVGYLTGYRSMAHDMSRHYAVAAVATRDGATLVLGAADAPPALEVLGDPACLFRYGTFFVETRGRSGIALCRDSVPSFGEALAAALHGLAPGLRLGVDRTGHAWRTLPVDESCPDARPALIAARRTKLPGEIARIRKAAMLLEEGVEAAFALAKAGVSECEIAAVVTQAIVAGGGVPRAIAVTSGPRSGLVDAFPSSRLLERGDLLRLDLDCTYDGYWADVARTGVIENASPLQRQRFDATAAGLEAERAALGPGTRACDLFAIAVGATRRAGLPAYRRQHCGHAIGIEANEQPRLAPGDETALEAGMVLCIETPFYEQDWGGLMSEDMVEITASGFAPITTLPADLRTCGGC
ncbi:M24 family metallopeptidase [Chelatococcus asaccharovorans]|uniref:Xaa-Pro aminopeptidase n=1 Tax=Chelatococcus asaccharovorans TaxID=28210 RepID=A0A2V3U122_9HYPH|nr:Xaa-Pro peptidase family protein [Chelatococcus asaccharovorans]MBS7707722.1 aminopeptidase P family protein [Chelatococcus asaccharovorans]PXW55299.1 Xaa-Pro aminopeptidase [Chelatococcus asaccharovorans]